MRVGQEDIFAVQKILRNFWRSLGQHVEVHFDRDRFVHVFDVGAMPTEGLGAFADFDATGINFLALEHLEQVLGMIFTHDTHEPDGREERGGIGKVNRRSADHLLALAGRRFQRVQSDRSSHQKRDESSKKAAYYEASNSI